MRIERFEETRALTDVELREALAGADARTRILAVWALGLRAPSAIELAGRLPGEPEAGVRRAMAVVLAGHGEVDLVVALARHDPNPYVRASALQMAMRFASAGTVPWAVIRERFTDDAAEVRAALLSQVQVAAPPEIRELVRQGLTDADDSVRREAFEVGIRLHAAGLLDDAAMRVAIEHMTRGTAKNELALWLKIGSATDVARVLAGASSEIRRQALELRIDLVLTDLLPLIAGDPELFDRLHSRHRLDLDAAPSLLVLRIASRTSWNGEYVAEADARVSMLERAPDELRDALRELAATCAAQIAKLDAVTASPALLLEYEDDDNVSSDELRLGREQFVRLRDRIDRLTGGA